MRRNAKYKATHAALARELHRPPVIPGEARSAEGRGPRSAASARGKRVIRRSTRGDYPLPANYVPIEQTRRPDFDGKPDVPPTEQPAKDVDAYWLTD